MKLVVDASVVAKWLFAEVDTPMARSVFAASQRGHWILLAPAILPAEIGSVLSTRVLRGLLQGDEAFTLFSRFHNVCPTLEGIPALADPALRLAVRFRHSFYDSLYMALAEREQCELVTADERMHRAFHAAFPQVRLLRDWR